MKQDFTRLMALCAVILFFGACSKKVTETQSTAVTTEKKKERFWTDTDTSATNVECPGRRFPLKYRLLDVHIGKLQEALLIHGDSAGKVAPDTVFIDIPMPDGTWETFQMNQVQVMAPELAAKYTGLKNYSGVSTLNSGDHIRFNLKPDGVSAMILGSKGTIFLDAYCKGDNLHMISFNKKDMPHGTKEEFETPPMK